MRERCVEQVCTRVGQRQRAMWRKRRQHVPDASSRVPPVQRTRINYITSRRRHIITSNWKIQIQKTESRRRWRRDKTHRRKSPLRKASRQTGWTAQKWPQPLGFLSRFTKHSLMLRLWRTALHHGFRAQGPLAKYACRAPMYV